MQMTNPKLVVLLTADDSYYSFPIRHTCKTSLKTDYSYYYMIPMSIDASTKQFDLSLLKIHLYCLLSLITQTSHSK